MHVPVPVIVYNSEEELEVMTIPTMVSRNVGEHVSNPQRKIRDRQTHRQTHRQTGRQAGRQTYRQTARNTHTHTDGWTDGRTDRQTERERHRERRRRQISLLSCI